MVRNALVVTCLLVAASLATVTAASVPAVAAAEVPSRQGSVGTVHLVACAPGYPGTTEGAQETMDAFAGMLADAAGREPGTVSAVYEEEEEAGRARIADPGTDLALVPLPFFLKYERELVLRPLLQVVQESGEATEEWSLVARRGSVVGPASLAGWTIEGIPAYAPAFVRGVVLGGWELPGTLRIRFQPRVLSALRRVSGGDDLAVLLDRAQTEALPGLPMASQLEVVATSPSVPAALVAAVGERLPEDRLQALVDGLLTVHRRPRFTEVLATLRMSRFVELDAGTLEDVRGSYVQARKR